MRSDPVWLLTTRGRPKLALEAVECAYRLSKGLNLAVYVDEVDDGYDSVQELVESQGGVYHHEREGGGLAHSLQWAFERWPDAACYGWLADDTFARTKGWNDALEAAAAEWRLVYADDLWLSHESPLAVQNAQVLTSGLCWGGELIRAVGRWSIPEGVKQAGIDEAWCYLVRELVCYRYVPTVIVEHYNWRTRKRDFDDTDEWVRDGEPYVERDCALVEDWKANGGARALLERLKSVFLNHNAAHAELMQRVCHLIESNEYDPNSPWPPFAGMQDKRRKREAFVREHLQKLYDEYLERS